MTLYWVFMLRATVFVCLGHRLGISKTRFRAGDMRRIDSLFCDLPPLLSRSNRKAKRKVHCSAMWQNECVIVWLWMGHERNCTTLGPASEPNKSFDLGQETADTFSLSVIYYQVLQTSSVCMICLKTPNTTVMISSFKESRALPWPPLIQSLLKSFVLTSVPQEKAFLPQPPTW